MSSCWVTPEGWVGFGTGESEQPLDNRQAARTAA